VLKGSVYQFENVRASALLLLLIYERRKFGVGSLQRRMLIPSFVKLSELFQTMKEGTQTES
jgi:hypothetical protein